MRASSLTHDPPTRCVFDIAGCLLQSIAEGKVGHCPESAHSARTLESSLTLHRRAPHCTDRCAAKGKNRSAQRKAGSNMEVDRMRVDGEVTDREVQPTSSIGCRAPSSPVTGCCDGM